MRIESDDCHALRNAADCPRDRRLKDTVHPYEEWCCGGNGFTFANYNAGDMWYVVREAARLFWDNKEAFAVLQKRAMTEDFSWAGSAKEYHQIYEQIR